MHEVGEETGQAYIAMELVEGLTLSAIIGDGPLSTEQVNAKARSLLAPVLGSERSEALLRAVGTLETLESVRALRSLLTAV